MRLAHLAKYPKILVTGPHRAGTTFAATAIAHDTGHFLALEEICRPNLVFWLTETDFPIVCQAPFAADICHTFQAFVVFMIRPLADIARSEQQMRLESGQRVNWNRMQTHELAKYGRGGACFGNGVAAAEKYARWPEQRERIKDWLELDYQSLETHELWRDNRDFHVRQTA